jgi:hypothetical protein
VDYIFVFVEQDRGVEVYPTHPFRQLRAFKQPLVRLRRLIKHPHCIQSDLMARLPMCLGCIQASFQIQEITAPTPSKMSKFEKY